MQGQSRVEQLIATRNLKSYDSDWDKSNEPCEFEVWSNETLAEESENDSAKQLV